MTDLVATDVVVSIVNKRDIENRAHNRCKLVFGDAALTYPAGGIPITKGHFGCPTIIESMKIVDQGVSGYSFSYDQSAEKIVMIQAPVQTHTHDILLKNAAVADGATERLNVAADKIGANTGADLTITGGGVNGGVVSTVLAAAAGSQPSTVAIAEQTIEVEVIGW